MRAIVNATLTFGSIYVPVGVATAAQRNDELKFRTLHVDCGTPIKLKKRCEKCEKVLESDELVSGYEIAKNQFVLVDKEELRQVMAPKSKMIELAKFVERDEVRPILVERSYFLTPSDTLPKPYEMLSAALLESNLVGIGKAVLWGKETPCAVTSVEGVLMLQMLFCDDEVVSSAEISSALKWDVSSEELDLTKQFLALRTDNLLTSDLHSESREKAISYIGKIAQGKTVLVEVQAEPEVTIDMMAELRKMVGVK